MSDHQSGHAPSPAARGAPPHPMPGSPPGKRPFPPLVLKLMLLLSLLLTGGTLALGLIVIDNQKRLMQDQMDEFGLSLARLLADSAREPLLAEDKLVLETVVSKFGNTRSSLGAVVFDDQGNRSAERGIIPDGTLASLYRQAHPLVGGGHSLYWKRRHRNGAVESMVSYLTPIRYRELVAGHALVTFSRRIIEERFQEALGWLLLALGSTLVFSLLLAWGLSRWLTRPLERLAHAAHMLGEGDLSVRLYERRRDEIGVVMQAFDEMANGLEEKIRVERALSRYLSHSVAEEVLNAPETLRLGGRQVEASVLFADIVGFTEMAEHLAPDEVSELLNEYFHYITLAAGRMQGIVDKFIGDCAMLVFGVPREDPEHHFHAVACAVLIRQLVERLDERRRAAGKPTVRFRIGINSGTMLAGNMGSPERMQYTVIGDAVNLASRLAAVANAGEIVIPEQHWRKVRDRVEANGGTPLRLKGRRDPVSLYRVQNLTANERHLIETLLHDILDGNAA